VESFPLSLKGKQMKIRKGYVYKDKATGFWYARITATDERGKRKDIKKRASDKTQANKLLKQLNTTLDTRGVEAVEAEKLTFDDLAEYYIKHYAKPAEYIDEQKVTGLRSVHEVLRYVKTLREYFGNRKLKSISYDDIRTFRQTRLATKTYKDTPRTIGSVNRELAYLRRMLNIAVRKDWIVKNPFIAGEPLILISAEKRRERILTLEEECKLLEACELLNFHLLRALLIALLDTGARKSEIASHLCWRAVDFPSRTITIEGMTTKTLKTRQVAMTSRLYTELEKLWVKSNKELDSPVFGFGVKTGCVNKQFSKVCKLAGLKQGGNPKDGLFIHSLRHTAATRLVKGQLPLQMVGRILGHTQPQTTYRYLSADAETTIQAAAILEAFQVKATETQPTNAPELIN
jgi:integrase